MEDPFKKRYYEIDEHEKGELLWVEKDSGAFNGPLNDWKNSHKKTVLEHCKEFHSVVMAGGNCGLYPLLYSKMFEYVYTFEPDYSNFHCLVNNNYKNNVFKMQVALGDENKLITLDRVDSSNVGMHRIMDFDYEHIPMIKLDNFHFDKLNLIHLDVEGYEEKVLIGARETLIKHKPMLLLETGARLENFLNEFGYKYIGNSVSDCIYIQK